MKTIFCLLYLFLIPNLIFSQEKLTYKDCLSLAKKNNLLLKNAALSEKIAVYRHRSSFGNFLPSVTGNAENKYSWGRDIDPTTNAFIDKNLMTYTGNITGLYTLFAGFYNFKTIQSAKQEVEINKAYQQKLQNEITIEITQKFIEILYLEELLLANKEQILSSKKQLELATLKFESGTIAESEVFKIESQKATEELILVTNQNQLSTNLIDLKQLLNIPLEKKISLVEPNLLITENNLLLENEYLIAKKAVEINPSFAMSKWLEKKAKTGIGLSRASKMPTLNLKFTYGSNYSDNDSQIRFEDQINTNLVTAIRLNLVIPIFSQFENTFKIKQSKLVYEQSKNETKIEESTVSKVVLLAINDTKAAIQKNEATTKAFDFARKSFEADALKYELGKINSTEFNVTKTNYKNAQAELIRAKYELIFTNGLVHFYLGEDFSL